MAREIQVTNQPHQNPQSSKGATREQTHGFPGKSTNNQGPRQSAKGSHEGSGFTGLQGGTSNAGKGSQSRSNPSLGVGQHYNETSTGDKK